MHAHSYNHCLPSPVCFMGRAGSYATGLGATGRGGWGGGDNLVREEKGRLGGWEGKVGGRKDDSKCWQPWFVERLADHRRRKLSPWKTDNLEEMCYYMWKSKFLF